VTCSPFWGLRHLFLYLIFRFGLVCRGNGTSIPAVFWLFYCRCFHFCTAPFGGCTMYSQVLGIGCVYRCSHRNGASIPGVFWCRSSPFCISLHLYPTLFKAPLTVRLHIYSDILVFMACGDPHSRIGSIYCGSRVIPFWGIVCKTFQEQLDGTVPGGCAIYYTWFVFPLQNLTSTGRTLFIKVLMTKHPFLKDGF